MPTLTKNQAMYLLKTVWPEAPETEIVKAAMVCYQYGLNPLMKQIYIVGFNKKGGGKTYSTILGIGATRLIAQQGGVKYSYVDGPRVMTEEEQQTIFGEVENGKLWAITVIQDREGNKYPGYGFWPKDEAVYGADKGNTTRNMAFIRSERNALDKMAPGALPDIDVTDDAFMEVNDMPAALEEGKQEFNEFVQDEIDELWPEGEAIPPHVPQTESALLDWVCEWREFSSTKTARAWLVNECHYAPEKIAKDPAGIYTELVERV